MGSEIEINPFVFLWKSISNIFNIFLQVAGQPGLLKS